jgi:NodT family efflux transporter outer membrane factor (OMF) lipoprotein
MKTIPYNHHFMKHYPQVLFPGVALALGLFQGCAVGPNYQQPKTTAPAQWSAPMAGGETNLVPSLAGWWKGFNDPQLDSLIERAVKANHDLQIAGARVREARAQYRIASSQLWPAVDAGGSYARQNQSKNQPIIGSLPVPPGTPFENNVYQAGFDASWEIDVFGGTRREVQAGKAEVAAAEFGRRNVLVTLLGEVARNYVETRGLQRRLEIANKNLKTQEEALAITENRCKNGLTSDLDVQQAATLLANTRAAIPTLESGIQGYIHRLGVLLGQPPEALLAELSAPAPIPAAPPVVPAGLPSDLLRRRPDIQQAERQLAAATARIGVATADLFPKFYLTGLAGFQSTSASDWFTGDSKFWSVGPTAQWRIFDAGRIRANIRVQNARQEQALAAYEKTVLMSFEDVENSLVAYAKEQIRRRSLEDAVKSSQDSLRLASQLYSNGLASFINVLDAERSLYLAEDALVQSDRAVTQNLISLYKALGGGWEALERPSQLAQTQTTK